MLSKNGSQIVQGLGNMVESFQVQLQFKQRYRTKCDRSLAYKETSLSLSYFQYETHTYQPRAFSK